MADLLLVIGAVYTAFSVAFTTVLGLLLFADWFKKWRAYRKWR